MDSAEIHGPWRVFYNSFLNHTRFFLFVFEGYDICHIEGGKYCFGDVLKMPPLFWTRFHGTFFTHEVAWQCLKFVTQNRDGDLWPFQRSIRLPVNNAAMENGTGLKMCISLWRWGDSIARLCWCTLGYQVTTLEGSQNQPQKHISVSWFQKERDEELDCLV